MDTKKNTATGPMTEKQYNFIKVLYGQVKEDLTANQDKNLVTKMRLHRDGKTVQSKEWANDTIEKLLKIRTNNALARVKASK